jgi:HAD superfamily hydrolase (TIGR01549 family)
MTIRAAQRRRMVDAVEIVFFDIGGVMYDDRVYALAWRRALREAGADFDDAAFEGEYAAARNQQNGSFRRRLTDRFLGPGANLAELERVAARYWSYPIGALEDDVRPCLEALSGRYRLGVIANQPRTVRTVLDRDGLAGFFEVWGVSEDLGVQKPDPQLFRLTLQTAGVRGSEAAMVGDRLDYDMRPAREAGMRTIWMLRGEAPDEPSAEQLAEPDAAIHGLDELSALLASWAEAS